MEDFYERAAKEHGDLALLPAMNPQDIAYAIPCGDEELYWLNLRGDYVDAALDSHLQASYEQNPAIVQTLITTYSGENKLKVSEVIGPCIGNVSVIAFHWCILFNRLQGWCRPLVCCRSEVSRYHC